VWVEFARSFGTPVDAACYYSIDVADPYATECWLYAPPFALVVGALQATIPFGAFVALLRAAETLALMLVVGPLSGLVAFIPQVATELNAANINLLLLAAVLAGRRLPWVWAFVILSKVTPAVGLLWFAARAEWRKLAMAVVATSAIALVSALVAPALWVEYVMKLSETPDDTGVPVGMRLPFAALLVLWGARTDRPWVLPIALFLSLPRLYFLSPVVLVGVLHFVHWSDVRRRGSAIISALRRQPAASSGSAERRAPVS
jgi:hypothetical protein